MQVLNAVEVEEVSGGIIPIALAIWYTGGFLVGVAGGYTFGKDLWD